MNRRLIALFVAVALAIGAGLAVWAYTTSVRSEVAEQDQTVKVLVAKEDIPASTSGEGVVESSLYEEAEIPTRYVSTGALSAPEQLKGKVVQTKIAKGQQIVDALLSTPEAEGLAWQIEKGMRAVSIPLDRVKGVGGMIQAGDRVDVIATFDYEVFNEGNVNLGQALGPEERKRIQQEMGIDIGASKGTVTRVLMQQVEVLSVDPVDRQAAAVAKESNEGGDVEAPNTPVAVVKVSLPDVERLVYAQHEGEVAFALVPADDHEPIGTPGQSIVNVFRPIPPTAPSLATPASSTSQ